MNCDDDEPRANDGCVMEAKNITLATVGTDGGMVPVAASEEK